MELALTTRTADGGVVVRVAGCLDLDTGQQLRGHLLPLAGDGHLVIDLDAVDFLDSTGLGVLVGALKRQRAAGGGFALVCAHERVLRTLRVTGLDRVFPLYADLPAALAACPVTGEPIP